MNKINKALSELDTLSQKSTEDNWLNRIHPLVKFVLTIEYISLVVSINKYDFYTLLSFAVLPLFIFTSGILSFKEAVYRLRIVIPVILVLGLFNPLFDHSVYKTIQIKNLFFAASPVAETVSSIAAASPITASTSSIAATTPVATSTAATISVSSTTATAAAATSVSAKSAISSSPYLTIIITGGMVSFVTLVLKGFFTVTASYILVASTSIEKLCHALALIHFPSILITQILLIYRYITVLLIEVKKITQAYSLRAPGQRGINIKAWGPLVGNLLLRTMDRSQNVYESMCLRGFNGTNGYFKNSAKIKFRTTDGIILVLLAAGFACLKHFPVIQNLGGLFA